MPLPLISLLALGVGASAGAAELSDERRALQAKQEEEKRAAAAELAKVRAEGEAKAAEAAAKKKAEILANAQADILKDREADNRRRRQFTEFTTLYSEGAPGISAAQATGYEGWDEGALATFRVPFFDAEGEQLVSDTGKPLFRPLQVRDSSQTGVSGATAEFQSMTGSDGMSRMALNWTRNNSPDDYNSFKTTLATTVRVMAGGTATPNIQGQTASVPVILPSTVRFLADKYSVDFAFEVVQDALVGTDQSGSDQIKQQYSEVFGAYPAKNAKAKVQQVNTPEGKGFTVSYPNGGGWLQGFDKPDGTLFENGRVVLAQAAKAIDVTMPKFEQFLVTEAEYRSDTLDREVLPGEIAYDIFTIRDSLSGYNLYNQPGAGAFFSVKTQANTYDRQSVEDLISKYGLFAPGGDYDADLALFQAIAPVGVRSYYPRADGRNTKSLLEGGQPAGAEIESPEFYAQPNDQFDEFINKKYGRVLGEDLQSFRNKGLAAGDAVLTLDSLIALDEQTQIPIPIGIAATGLTWIVSARDQIDSILEVVDVVGLSDENKAFVRDKLGKTRAELESGNFEGMTTQDVVNAISLRNFHEGVLVYSMAMALQGGNAAARTISDADITRIREILALSAGASREQRKTIYTALRNMMKRQKAISDAAVGGGEAGVWAAATMSEFTDRVAIVRNELDSVLKLARRTVGKRIPETQQSPAPGVEPGSPVPDMPGFIYDQNGNAVPA